MLDLLTFDSLLLFFVVSCCPSAVVLLCGLKSDLTDRIAVSPADAAKQAKEWGATHVSLSAKSGHNCDGLLAFVLANLKAQA